MGRLAGRFGPLTAGIVLAGAGAARAVPATRSPLPNVESTAGAASATPPAPGSGRFVVVATADGAPGLAAALRAVRAHTSDISARIVLAPGPGGTVPSDHPGVVGADLARAPGVLGVFTLVPDDRGGIVVSLVDRSGSKVLLETSASRLDSPAGLESIAVVVRATADALAERPAAPRAETSVSSRPHDPPRTRRLALAAAYAGASFAPEDPWTGGLRLAAEAHLGAAYVGAAYTAYQAAEAAAEGIEVTVKTNPVAAFAGYRAALGSRLALAGESGLVVDRAARRARATQADTTPRPASAVWLLALTGAVQVEVRALPHLRLRAGPTLDAYLSSVSYHADGPERATVLAPRILRPGLRIGLALEWP